MQDLGYIHCYGLGSLEETPRLDRYKKGMGYEMKPIKQRLYFRKGVRILFRPSILNISNFINKHIVKGRSYTLDKGCCLLRRYLEQQ